MMTVLILLRLMTVLILLRVDDEVMLFGKADKLNYDKGVVII